MPPRKRRSFTAEYKVEAAHRVIDSGRTIAEVARELGRNDGLLSNWVKDERRRIAAAEAQAEKPLEAAERAELLRLRRQVSGQRVPDKSLGVLCRDAEETERFDLMAKYAGPDTLAGTGMIAEIGTRISSGEGTAGRFSVRRMARPSGCVGIGLLRACQTRGGDRAAKLGSWPR